MDRIIKLSIFSLLVGCSSADFTVAPSPEYLHAPQVDGGDLYGSDSPSALPESSDAAEASEDGARVDSMETQPSADSYKPTVTAQSIPNPGTLSPALSCTGDDVVTNVPRSLPVNHFDIGIKWYSTAGCNGKRAQIYVETVLLDTVIVPSSGSWTYTKVDKSVSPYAGIVDVQIVLLDKIDKCGSSTPACEGGGFVRPMDGSYVKMWD